MLQQAVRARNPQMTDAWPMPIPEDRPLTAEEQSLVQWLLEHGNSDAAPFLSQLSDARVVSRCPCGCASIDLSIGGIVPPSQLDQGMQTLSDYVWQTHEGAKCGVFVFSVGGQLAGLEVWSLDGLSSVSSLPSIDQLLPIDLWQASS